ncbi:MAG: LysM domain-containing protein [Patescibacteria group bacterium]|jgi:LysM repeat protein
MKKPILTLLIIIIAGLTVSTSYFYNQSKKSPNTNTGLTNITPDQTENENINQSLSNINTNTNSLNQNSNTNISTDGEVSPAVNKNRASNPEKTYQVKSGETLYPIGLKFNLDWNYIARANGLEDSNSIKANSVLVIPIYDTDSKKLSVNYSVDQAKADELQKNISTGKETWRLDPIEVAKKESYPCFGFSSNDTYTLASKSEEKGIAQISVVKNNISYEIGLTEPATKGADGIWTISYIKEI